MAEAAFAMRLLGTVGTVFLYGRCLNRVVAVAPNGTVFTVGPKYPRHRDSWSPGELERWVAEGIIEILPAVMSTEDNQGLSSSLRGS